MRKKNGFTLLEVAIAMLLILIVAASAGASLRTSLKALGGTESSSLASSAIREFREFTFTQSVAELDVLAGTTMAPVLSNGDPMPESQDIALDITVVAVDDSDPGIVVQPADSSTRLVTVSARDGEMVLLEATWLASDS